MTPVMISGKRWAFVVNSPHAAQYHLVLFENEQGELGVMTLCGQRHLGDYWRAIRTHLEIHEFVRVCRGCAQRGVIL